MEYGGQHYEVTPYVADGKVSAVYFVIAHGRLMVRYWRGSPVWSASVPLTPAARDVLALVKR